MADEEGPLVQLLSSKPRSDLAVVFARVARRAGRDHVLEGVAATAGDRHDAVALHGSIRSLAVSAAAPCIAKAGPLRGREVVVHACQPLLPPLGIPCAGRGRPRSRRELATGRHTFTVLRRIVPDTTDAAAWPFLVVHVPGIGPHALIDFSEPAHRELRRGEGRVRGVGTETRPECIHRRPCSRPPPDRRRGHERHPTDSARVSANRSRRRVDVRRHHAASLA